MKTIKVTTSVVNAKHAQDLFHSIEEKIAEQIFD